MVGAFVLMARSDPMAGSKLNVKWVGPQGVPRIESEWVFACQDLVNGPVFLIHANRLKFYSDSQLNITQELLETIDHNDPHCNVAVAFLYLRYNRSNRRYELKSKWRGFADELPTWEPLSILIEDAPDMV